MRAIARKALADVRRRRFQTGVIALVSMLSALAASMALSLLVESDAPYDHAFSRANGPHLVVYFDAAKTTESQVSDTRHGPGVTQAIGPLRSTSAQVEFGQGGKGQSAITLPINVFGRSAPDLAVDRLTMFSGRWARASDEIVLSLTLTKHTQTAVGDVVSFPEAPGAPKLRVVGIAAPISSAAEAWVLPEAVSSLAPAPAAGKPATPATRWVMEYRVASATDPASLTRVLNAIGSQVPAGSVAGSVSWLDARKSADLTASVMVPFLVVFSALGLLAAAFVISNVVSGMAIADRRQMGIMKSIGFTPVQVAAVLVVQVLIPMAFGATAGVFLGTLLSQPFLAETAQALGLPTFASDTALVDAGVLALVGLLGLAASLAPATRAGRMSAVSAIAVGTGPGSTRGAGTIVRLSRLRLGAPIRLGLADLAARPVRAAMTGLAVVLGVATVVFAVALTLSLDKVASSLSRAQQVQVNVSTPPDQPAGNVATLIGNAPHTARFVSEGQTKVTVPGIASPIPFYGYQGESGWIGYAMISGRWFAAPAEVVAPSHLMDVTGLRLGQTLTASVNGRAEQLTLVGEIFDQADDNLLLRGNWADLLQLDPKAVIDQYEVQLTPGADPRQYASSLESAGGRLVDARPARSFSADAAFLLIESVLSGLAVVLAGIAGAGVLNTVVLRTRERRREIAILKAIGMAPSQVVVMVVSSVALLGLAAGLVGAPLGLGIHHQILTSMAEIATHARVPSSFYSVLGLLSLVGLTLAGMLIAAAGAWLPAQWAAAERVSGALHAE